MKKFEIEWGFYLQAYRLQQGLTRRSNEESQRLLRQSITAAGQKKRVIARAHGLLGFAILTAWLCDWIDDAAIERILQGCIEDLNVSGLEGASMTASLAILQSEEPTRDILVRNVIKAYGGTAKELDDSDFENHWSLATADLYDRKFAEARDGYKSALKMSDVLEVPVVGKSSLAVDFADFRFFAGNDGLENTESGWIEAITEAIELTKAAMAENPTDPKRHRWNWTLGWAYYELAAFKNEAENLYLSKNALEELLIPHDLIRKNLMATYAALGMMEKAKEHAAVFMMNNADYKLAVEDRWPYRIKSHADRWKSHLAKALEISQTQE